MTSHTLHLRGCTPEPLGNYLKGLGVFRLIAEQADPQARAWWQDGYLAINTCFDSQDALAKWFRDKYEPTGLIAPWSVNSGFWPPKKLPPPRGDKRATANSLLRRLVMSENPRFLNFKEPVTAFLNAFGGEQSIAIQESELTPSLQQLLGDLEKAKSKSGIRSLMLRSLRSSAPNAGIAWLDAIGTVKSSRDADAVLFSLLADGGTEGVNSFVGNFYARLCDHLPIDTAPIPFWKSVAGITSNARLQNSLFSRMAMNAREADAASGLYWPSLVEAPNIGQEFISVPKKRAQPWDFLLAMEGFPLWSSAATRRSERLSRDRVSFPFYCDGSVGGASSLSFNEMSGGESISNGEIWCPLWTTPAVYLEVKKIFSDGRLLAFEKTATKASQFAAAVANLGVESGITAFQRVGLLERSGSGSHTTTLAIHLGTWPTRMLSDVALLDELRVFEEAVSSGIQAHASQARRFIAARQSFEHQLLDASAATGDYPSDARERKFLNLLIAVGRIERELSLTKGIVKVKVRQQLQERQIAPLNRLSRNWRNVCGINSVEFHLSSAVAGISSWFPRDSDNVPSVDCLRANLLPVARGSHLTSRWEWHDSKHHKTSHSTVWCDGASLEANLSAVLRRRLIDASRENGFGLPLYNSNGAGFIDILAFWNREVDESRIAALIHGLALIDTGNWDTDDIVEAQIRRDPTPDLRTGGVYFTPDGDAPTKLKSVQWQEKALLTKAELQAAFELPRVYHLLKLCFVGGQLPRRPVDRKLVVRTGDEPFPANSLDILTLLQAGRLSDALTLAARRLRAKGYPSLLKEADLTSIDLDEVQCRRLASMMLIPIRLPGVCAALAIKPQTTNS